MKSINHAVVVNNHFAAGVMRQVLPGVRMAEEHLPFTVRVVRSEEALHKAVSIRQAAYARHVPEFAERLKVPEAKDRNQGAIVLLAESKLDDSPVGTMRIEINRFNGLAIEQSVELPAHLRGSSMAQATRLANDGSRMGRLVKTVLFKAFYLYCMEAGIEWMVIAARPPLDRQYMALLFEDLYPGELIPLSHVNNIPHRVLAFDVGAAEKRWREPKHPLFDFVFRTYHPDVDLSDSDSSPLSRQMRTAERQDMVAAVA